jgi:hypothetical protein
MVCIFDKDIYLKLLAYAIVGSNKSIMYRTSQQSGHFSKNWCCNLLLFTRLYFVEQLYIYSKIEQKFPYIPSHYTCTASLLLSCHTKVVHLYNWLISTDTSLSPKSIASIRVWFWYLHSMGFDKCIITYFHHYGMIKNSLTDLNTCAWPVHSSVPHIPNNEWSFSYLQLYVL